METSNSTKDTNHLQHTAKGGHVSSKARNETIRRISVGAATVILIVVGALITLNFLGGPKPNQDRYQAVFLSNGQVFFGKLENTSGTYLVLDKAFYTQKQTLPDNATAEQKAATANNVSLIKVGNEVYGPENSMRIRADQVLFWQDLRSDSKVSKAIEAKN